MVTILIFIALYLMFGVLAAALVYSGPEKEQSCIEVVPLIFIILVWPAVGLWYVFNTLETPSFRNPFWDRRKPS